MLTVAMLVTDTEKTAVEASIASITPDYAVGFVRKVVPAVPAPTWETPHSHWYMNAEPVPDDVVTAWIEQASALPGLAMFTAANAANSLEWAASNLASQGLVFQPDAPA